LYISLFGKERWYNIAMTLSAAEYYREPFYNLSLEKGSIENKVFDECQFNRCSFIEMKFNLCKFRNCSFTECILSAVVPMNARFAQVKFINCKVIGFDWTKTTQSENLEFLACQINYSNFKLMKIPKTKIISCEAKEVDFTEADLTEADLKKTDFEKSRFFKTNLSHADLTAAKNYYIDVKNNTLKRTRFSLPEALALLNSLDIIID
jgi:fluoroquinolone resistance protein